MDPHYAQLFPVWALVMSATSDFFTEKKHFSNVGKKLDRNIPKDHHDPTYYMGPPSKRSFFVYPSSSHEAEGVVNF